VPICSGAWPRIHACIPVSTVPGRAGVDRHAGARKLAARFSVCASSAALAVVYALAPVIAAGSAAAPLETLTIRPQPG
jgi:hypothetical protein